VPTAGAHAPRYDGARAPRERELAAQVARPLGADAPVGAHGDDPVVLAHGRAGRRLTGERLAGGWALMPIATVWLREDDRGNAIGKRPRA
jgi:hypothetical protein